MQRNTSAVYAVLLAWLILAGIPAQARNIDLSTVPPRATVQLTIYNAEDLTLVRETRAVSFKKGVNPLQFSWANTLIDPTSVELEFLDHQAELEVLDTSYPHDKPEMLYWNVHSAYEGEATLAISYFTSGIAWQADYLGISNPAEDRLSLESFVRVYNSSGEDYENAQVRLVVGKINLVEKIAQLAQAAKARGAREGRKEEKPDLRLRAAKQAMAEAMPAPKPAFAGAVYDALEAPKEVAKEGLGEYFIYTIEGTETIPNGWSKRLRSFEAHDVPFKVQYRYRPQEYGERLVRLYLLKNDSASKLGTTPLPDGTIRIFRDNGRDGLSYLAAQTLRYIPIGDKIELNLGEDPEVIFELIKLKVARDEILLRLRGVEVYRKLGGGVQFESDSTVAGWDEHEVYTQRIRNYSRQPIELEIRRAYQGDVVFKSDLKPTLHDFRTVQFTTNVAPGEKKDLLHEVLTRQGKNAKKNNVELAEGL
jgi:hypothetical protein